MNAQFKKLPATIQRQVKAGKRLEKVTIGNCIGLVRPYAAEAIYWNSIKREDLVETFNFIFKTTIK